MSIATHLQRPGSGEVRLLDETPFGVTAQILKWIDTIGCHLIVTSIPIDLSIGDAGILAAAKADGHTMRVMTRPDRTSITVAGISTWMDTDLETGLAKTAGTPTAWVTDLIAGTGLVLGTVSGGSNVTHEFKARAQTKRGALDVIAEMGGFKYRINPDFTIDIGTNLFRSPPLVVITNRAEGPDGDYVGLLGSIPGPNVDASNPATKVVAVGQGSGASVVTGEATQSIPLLRWDGVAATFVRTVSAPAQTATGAATVADKLLPSFSPAARTITVVTGPSLGGGGTGLGGGGTGPTVRASGGANLGGHAGFDGPYSGPIFGAPKPGSGGTDLGSGGGPSLDWAGRGRAAARAAARRALRGFGNRSSIGGPSTEAPQLHRFVRVGDEVYVYDLEAGIVDTGQQILYRGETISPAKLTVIDITHPNEASQGYYIRPNGTTITGADYLDITPYVIPEAPGATLEVGSWTPSTGGVANRSNPAVEERIGSTAALADWSNPIITQGGTVAGTVTRSLSTKRPDGTFWAMMEWVATAAGTAGNAITISTPYTMQNASDIGGTIVFLDSGTAYRFGGAFRLSTTAFRVMLDNRTAALGIDPAITLAIGDTMYITVTGTY